MKEEGIGVTEMQCHFGQQMHQAEWKVGAQDVERPQL